MNECFAPHFFVLKPGSLAASLFLLCLCRDMPGLGSSYDEKQMEARRTLTEIYTQYAPDKLGNIDMLLEAYSGQEDELVTQIKRKYLSPVRSPNGKPQKSVLNFESPKSEADYMKDPNRSCGDSSVGGFLKDLFSGKLCKA